MYKLLEFFFLTQCDFPVRTVSFWLSNPMSLNTALLLFYELCLNCYCILLLFFFFCHFSWWEILNLEEEFEILRHYDLFMNEPFEEMVVVLEIPSMWIISIIPVDN